MISLCTGSICEGCFSIDLIHCYPFISGRGSLLAILEFFDPLQTPYFEDACLQLDVHSDDFSNWCGNLPSLLRRKCLYIERTYILGGKVLLLLLLKMMIAVVMTMMMMRKWTAQSFKETATFTVYVIVIDDENRGDDGDDGDDGEADCPILHRSGRFEDASSLQVHKIQGLNRFNVTFSFLGRRRFNATFSSLVRCNTVKVSHINAQTKVESQAGSALNGGGGEVQWYFSLKICC